MSFILKITKEIGIDFLEDLLITAVEGGSNYWIESINTEDFYKVFTNGGGVYIDDGENVYELTLSKMMKGVQLYTDDTGFDWTLDYDAADADCVLQYALFEDLVYG